MRWKRLRTFAVRSFALVVGLGAAGKAQAPDTTTPSPNMAPVDQYLMEDREAEIALARSAAFMNLPKVSSSSGTAVSHEWRSVESRSPPGWGPVAAY
jgi:hypothetical protein